MLSKAIRQLQEFAVEAAWRQWEAVGGVVSSKYKATAIIDPEALVLLSLALREKEYRLWDMLSWWAINRSKLLSVQRIKNLSGAYPEIVRQKLKEFADLAFKAGGDFRWKSLLGTSPQLIARPAKTMETDRKLRGASNLMLRLRLGIGVGIKADILAVLIGLEGKLTTIKTLTYATAYTARAIRRSADGMCEARFIQIYDTNESEITAYYLDPHKWWNLMGIIGPGTQWRFLHSIFAFVSHVLANEREIPGSSSSSYLVSSRLRDLVESALPAFQWNQIKIPESSAYMGADFIRAFEEIIKIVGEWMYTNV